MTNRFTAISLICIALSGYNNEAAKGCHTGELKIEWTAQNMKQLCETPPEECLNVPVALRYNYVRSDDEPKIGQFVANLQMSPKVPEIQEKTVTNNPCYGFRAVYVQFMISRANGRLDIENNLTFEEFSKCTSQCKGDFAEKKLTVQDMEHLCKNQLVLTNLPQEKSDIIELDIRKQSISINNRACKQFNKIADHLYSLIKDEEIRNRAKLQCTEICKNTLLDVLSWVYLSFLLLFPVFGYALSKFGCE